jgi:two-component system cell cycle response regulator DivK
MREDKQAIMDVAFYVFIEKPVGFKEFLNTISSTLQNSIG